MLLSWEVGIYDSCKTGSLKKGKEERKEERGDNYLYAWFSLFQTSMLF